MIIRALDFQEPTNKAGHKCPWIVHSCKAKAGIIFSLTEYHDELNVYLIIKITSEIIFEVQEVQLKTY